ncbi:hypothetical protein BYT27DRAFT_7200023 [Phlegmacium glaucopus]|nr:hypothetical protein BYT27DRAFT_7200023 [Phlegmacium glaucopus]
MHFCTFCFHLQDFDLRCFFYPVKIERFLGSRKAYEAATVLAPTNARALDATIRLACVEIPLLLCHMRWGPTHEDEKDIQIYQTFSTATARQDIEENTEVDTQMRTSDKVQVAASLDEDSS